MADTQVNDLTAMDIMQKAEKAWEVFSKDASLVGSLNDRLIREGGCPGGMASDPVLAKAMFLMGFSIAHAWRR